MFYIVPKDHSIDANVGAFGCMHTASTTALKLKEENGINYDIIQMECIWTTQTFDEAHMLSLDIPHIGRD